jgi:hypothetical protein
MSAGYENSRPGDWAKVIRRIRFDGVVKGVRGATLKLVALTVGSYAEYEDGSRVRPGTALIAIDAEISYQTAKRCVAALRDLGLIRMVRRSTGRGYSDEYRLALPADLLDRVEVLDPAQVDLAKEAVRGANRRRPRPHELNVGPPTDDGVTRRPVDNDAPSITRRVTALPPTTQDRDPAPPPATETATGDAVTDNPTATGDAVTARRVTAYPPTTQDRDNLRPRQPTDLRTDLTVVGYPQAAQDPDSVVAGVDPPLTAVPDPDPAAPTRLRPAGQPAPRCEHGMPDVIRGDGAHACVFCRRHLPAGPPVEALPANVIPLRRTQTA